jgi:hypothetical protein
MSDNPNMRSQTGFFTCQECGDPMHRVWEANRSDSLLSEIIMHIDRKGFKKRWPLAYFQCESCDALSALAYEEHSGCISVCCMTVVKDMKGFRYDTLKSLRETIGAELDRVMEGKP